jgi:hypothetical protein
VCAAHQIWTTVGCCACRRAPAWGEQISRSHRVFEWFREIGEEIQAGWERLHQQAESDPQRAGHGGEATWADHLGNATALDAWKDITPLARNEFIWWGRGCQAGDYP